MDKNKKNNWLRSLGVTMLIFLLLSLYLFIRQGYYNISTINKVFGSSAIILAGLTLIIGPLSKRWDKVTELIPTRKHLGLLALYLALLHVVLSLISQERFPFPAWYMEEWLPVIFGIIALSIWYYMKTLSNNKKITQLGIDIWKKRLSIAGKLAFIAIFLHVTVMKYPGWIRWISGQSSQGPELVNPGYPPTSLLLFICMIGVICYLVMTNYIKKGGGTNGK